MVPGPTIRRFRSDESADAHGTSEEGTQNENVV